jgi:tRNA-splicing ligase RtcB (3'-phosphate/5'-hydroxy nucleic acid ligase)
MVELVDTTDSSPVAERREGSTPSIPTCSPSGSCYYSKGCGRDECRRKKSDYAKERKRIRERPDSDWDNPLVDVTPARKHLLFLKDQGVGLPTISMKTGMASKNLYMIRNGKTRLIYKKNEKKILSMGLDPYWTDSTEAQEHLKFLYTRGIGTHQISKVIGVPSCSLLEIRRGRRVKIKRETSDKILACGTHMFTPSPLLLRRLQGGIMPVGVGNKLLVWGMDDIEEATVDQALKTTTLPFVEGHVALMPDAHVGLGSTVGSVIPTRGAIIPSAIGVDIGCGMAAVKFNFTSDSLPEDLSDLMPLIEQAIPAGVGKSKGQDHVGCEVNVRNEIGEPQAELTSKQKTKLISQCGTLGSGNHFFEICLDEMDHVWIVLHSGSRGIGNDLAKQHIEGAKKLMKRYFIELDDPDLAYLVEGTGEFDAYITDMLWAQEYARLNREVMLSNAVDAFLKYLGHEEDLAVGSINCHHNFTQKEHHNGKNLWITRKGAIKADVGDLGIIPGSMGTDTYIVRGLGHPGSYKSCSHGAGRRHSRTRTKQLFDSEALASRMEGKVWNSDRASNLVDEIPDAYKSIESVMAAQRDLVEVVHKLSQIFNYKGT